MIKFKPFRRFFLKHENPISKRLIDIAIDGAERSLKRGMRSKKSGRLYRRRGALHRASRAGEYPAVDSGELFKSINTTKGKDKGEIGTGAKHAIYLRRGTSKMARRRMSDDAIKEGIEIYKRSGRRRFVKFSR